MNADLVTDVNFDHMLEYHQQKQAVATMAVRTFETTIPYGVVDQMDGRIRGILEKPIHKVFINAGVYVLDPRVLSLVPADSYFDMPELFDRLLERGDHVASFPLREDWIDIGVHHDLERAQLKQKKDG